MVGWQAGRQSLFQFLFSSFKAVPLETDSWDQIVTISISLSVAQPESVNLKHGTVFIVLIT